MNGKLKSVNQTLDSNYNSITQTIKDMDSMEKYILEKLKSSQNNPNVTDVERMELIKQAKNVGNMKKHLYTSLNNSTYLSAKHLGNQRDIMGYKDVMGTLLKRDNDRVMGEINTLEQQVIDYKRQTEINNYEKLYTRDKLYLLLVIVVGCSIAAMSFYLNTKFGYMNNIIKYVLYALIIIPLAVVAIFVFFKVNDISKRSNMDYEKYDWASMNIGENVSDRSNVLGASANMSLCALEKKYKQFVKNAATQVSS